MTNSNRNTDRRYVGVKVTGAALLIILIGGLFLLLSLIIPVRILLWILACLVVLILVVLAVGAIIPFHPDEIILMQGNEAISDLDRKLLEMALSKEISQAELDDFLNDWDIEVAPIKSVMLLAYLMKTRPDLKFHEITPRLDGVLSFCKFQNVKRQAHLSKVGKVLNKEGIPFAILKGGAMKVYRPDFPRWMNDIDIIVPEADYQRVVELVMGMGYDKPMKTDHSVDLHLPGSDEGLLDIHERMEMFTGLEEAYNEGLFTRSEEVPMFSVRGLLPCPEDMVFIAFVNLYKNLAKNQTPESIITTFFDMKYLISLKPGFDWEIVKDSARKTGTEFQVYYSVVFLSSIIPNVFPVKLLEPDLSDKELENQLLDFLFRRDVVSEARDSLSRTSVGASLQKGYNPIVFMWVSFVSLLKRVFSNRLIKKTLLVFRYRVLPNFKLS